MKRKTSGSAEKDWPVLAKAPKLGASPTSSVRRPERTQSPIAKAPMSLPPPSKSTVKAKKSLGWICQAAIDGYADHRLESADGEC